MPEPDYRDYLLTGPAPALLPGLALALGWHPVYDAPLAPPAYWISPAGTRCAVLPAAADLLAAVRAGRARIAALERVLADVTATLARAQDALDLAEQPARATDCYIARQQIAALFPPP